MTRSGIVDFALSLAARGGGPPLAFAANVIVARMLGPAQFGRYVTLLSTGLIAGGIASHGVGRVLTREIAVRPSAHRADLVATMLAWVLRLIAPLSLGITALVVVWLTMGPRFGAPAADWYGRAAVVILVPCCAAVVVIVGILTGLSRVAASQLIGNLWRNALLVVGVLGFLAVGATSAEELLWLQAATYVGAGALGIYLIRHALVAETNGSPAVPRQGSASREEHRRWSRSANHFFAMAIANLLFLRLDVVIVNAIAGQTQAGIFGAAARLAQLGQLAGLVWLAWLQPRLARYAQRQDWDRLHKTMRVGFVGVTAMTALPVLFAWPFASEIVRVMGVGYGAAAAPFQTLLGGELAWALAVPAAALLAMTGREKFLALVIWAQLALTLTICFPLIRAYGAAGGAWAWAGGAIFSGALILVGGLIRLLDFRRG